MAYTDLQLTLMQTDLGLLSPTANQTAMLGQLLDMARAAIARRGIALTDGVSGDDMLVAMYAAWLYRKRAADPASTAMPRMIQSELHDRLASQKMAAAT